MLINMVNEYKQRQRRFSAVVTYELSIDIIPKSIILL